MKTALAEVIRGEGAAERIEGVRVGTIVLVDKERNVLVDYPGNVSGPIPARFIHALRPDLVQQMAALQQEVLLVFENGDPGLPIIIDTLCRTIDESCEQATITLAMAESDEVTIDGSRVTFDAKEEIVLRCGKASITLTKAGKVIIRGSYLVSRSSGVNKIKGGSVQIN